MRTLKSQTGIGHIVVIMALLMVGVVGFAGYKVVTKQPAQSTAVRGSSQVDSIAVPAKISTKADLETTTKALDGSSTQVDSGLNDNSLDADLSDML